VEPSLPLRARAIDAVDRVTEGLVALYRFKAGAGTTIHDTAPNGPALNLTIGEEGAVRWANKSLSIVNPTTITSRSAASKLIDAIKRSGELSVELWLKPRDADPSGLAPIVALSENPEYVNFMVGQGAPDTDDPGGEARGAGGGDRYVARLRTTQTSASGEPGLRSSGGAAKPALTHLVYTRDESGTGQWFIDGRGRAKQPQAGELNNWSPQHMLSLGSLPTGEHHWFGDLRLVAIYSQALSRKQVQRNFDVGLVEPEVLADRDREQAAKDARKPDWQDVTLLRGVGSDRTLRFDVPGEEWKVRYKIKVTEATGEPFEVRVVPTADTNKAEQLFRIGSLEPNAPVADEALTPFGAGEYYLQVSGPDGAVWDMQVKQLR
jgi:hypothetical protein